MNKDLILNFNNGMSELSIGFTFDEKLIITRTFNYDKENKDGCNEKIILSKEDAAIVRAFLNKLNP